MPALAMAAATTTTCSCNGGQRHHRQLFLAVGRLMPLLLLLLLRLLLWLPHGVSSCHGCIGWVHVTRRVPWCTWEHPHTRRRVASACCSQPWPSGQCCGTNVCRRGMHHGGPCLSDCRLEAG